MNQFQTFLFEQDYRKLTEIIARLQLDTSAKAVFLFDRNGQQIALQGSTDGIDITSFASLAAGNVAATEGLAKLVGEKEFPSQFHEGLHSNIYMSTLGKRAILVVIFNERSSVGLVRLRVKRAMIDLGQAFDEMSRRTEIETEDLEVAGQNSEFIEITDEDIENLFH